ncbi:GNAT family N-acetyltransferase [Brevibacillus sp. SYSU BS000544]|uniref:GNAT family N-acetyltransferase n=1 Tax=Brevibacillus sp. SYSU BS000544 TaxID=3416443 RepID=UPI003CE4C0E7
MDKELVITHECDPEESTYIRNKLIEFNNSKVSPELSKTPVESVGLLIKGDNGEIFGGLTGMIYWNHLRIDILWVDESLRGKGYGKKLLDTAEEVARSKGCTLITLDTFSFQAPQFYQSQGFEIFGTHENFPEGFTHYYLTKKLE